MANNAANTSKYSNRSINHKIDLLDQKLNSMYKDTYIIINMMGKRHKVLQGTM